MIEGFPTLALGLLVVILMPSLPDRVARKGHFLFKNERDREIMLARQIAGQSGLSRNVTQN
jgi:hypothetical protein